MGNVRDMYRAQEFLGTLCFVSGELGLQALFFTKAFRCAERYAFAVLTMIREPRCLLTVSPIPRQQLSSYPAQMMLAFASLITTEE